MIELDEKDIKAVGRSRFIRKSEKKLARVFIISIAVLAGLLYLTYEVENPLRYIPFIPLAVMLGYLVWYAREMAKAEKEFFEDWKGGK